MGSSCAHVLFTFCQAEESLKQESGSKVQHANIQASKILTMSGAGGKKKDSNLVAGSQPRGSMIPREESNGKKHGNVNAKTMCKIDHLKYLAAETSVPSLGAFFGERLAATTKALGLRSDPSFFVCERCESILQPGHNCSVRIEKNKSRGRHKRKKSNPTTQNNIVYRCYFCSHRNLIRGTSKGHVKEICPPKPRQTLKLKKASENCPSLGNATTTTEYRKVCPVAFLPLDGQNADTIEPATPLPIAGLSLLDSKRKKRNRPTAKKVDKSQISSSAADLETSILASSKRRKKSWTSLKEIAESSGKDVGKKLTDLSIPFVI